jgi:CelD/BcsL family acetyltransferase involved in cellulose biosynthesis
VAEAYGFRPFCLTVRDRRGRIVAGTPVIEVRHRRSAPKWVSLPFTDHCPPLIAADLSAGDLSAGDLGAGDLGAGDLSLGKLFDSARRAAGIDRFEVRGALAGPGSRQLGEYVTHDLPLTGTEDEIFATFHASQVRRNVKRARQSGVTVRIATTEADLTTVFYQLHTRTRRRLGVPVQPLRYFRTLWRRALEPGLGVVMIAEVDGAPAAAAVLLASPAACVYKYGASDERRWHARPNHLLFWEGIRWARARGCRRFDFGRTDLEDRGLWEFKTRWGTAQRPLAYHLVGDGPPADAGHAGMSPSLRTIIRNGPQIVPRILGEVRYRYHA